MGHCIPCDIWIEQSDNQSEVLMKLVSTLIYDIYLENWVMDCISKIAQTFDKASRDIHLWLQYLQGKEIKEIQQFQDTRYQTPAQ